MDTILKSIKFDTLSTYTLLENHRTCNYVFFPVILAKNSTDGQSYKNDIYLTKGLLEFREDKFWQLYVFGDYTYLMSKLSNPTSK